MSADRDPIPVYSFGPAWGMPVPTPSPFGLKLLAWMHLHDVPYRLHVANNPGKGPKGKCPWAVVDGQAMGDSELVIRALRRRRGIADDELTPQQRALATAVRLMLEEHYHQVWEHQLFIHEGSWERAQEFFDQLPPGVRVLVRTIMRRQLRQQLVARGVGRHSQEQIVEMGVDVLEAVDALLDPGPFVFGDEPTDIDACVFAFMAVTKWTPGQTALWDRFAALPRLGEYCERMRARCFPS
ncbi:MAG: glutathione S-transferase family protein [Myxococcales bacterium]|nr:glutathione S-transferase family protein [Myxococcales bacterium]